MLACLNAELFKLRKRTTLWLLVIAWMLLSLLFGYVFPYLSYRGLATGPGAAGGETAQRALSSALPGSLASTAIAGFPLFAGALALVLGVLTVGSEYGWQTVKVMFTQGPRRSSVLAGKVGAVLVIMLGIVIVTFVLDGAASLLVASMADKSVSWPGFGDLLRGMGAGWLIVSMWALGGMFLGFILRGTALAVGIGLVWALLVENLLRAFASSIGVINTLQQILPRHQRRRTGGRDRRTGDGRGRRHTRHHHRGQWNPGDDRARLLSGGVRRDQRDPAQPPRRGLTGQPWKRK